MTRFAILERFSTNLGHRHGGDFGPGQGAGRTRCLAHRDRTATPPRTKIAPPRRGRPQGDDGGPSWSKTALAATCLALALPGTASATITQTFTSRSAFATAFGPITSHAIGLAGTPPVLAGSLVTGPITITALGDQLAGNGGDIISTALDSDVLILDFAQPVFAVGLFGGIDDADFAFFEGETAIDVIGSGTTGFANTGTAQYFGLVSDTAFSQLRLSVRSFDGGTSSVAFVGLKRGIDLVGGVPEPSTWGLMMLGFGALGLIARRRAGSMRAQTA